MPLCNTHKSFRNIEVAQRRLYDPEVVIPQGISAIHCLKHVNKHCFCNPVNKFNLAKRILVLWPALSIRTMYVLARKTFLGYKKQTS